MIQAYDETWQFYIRQLTLTSRRPFVQPYPIIRSLYDFLKSTGDTPVLDIGCGENNLKHFFPNIDGMDMTCEADIKSYVDSQSFKDVPKYKYGVAVNVMNWPDGNTIDSKIKLALSKCDKVWFSMNDLPSLIMPIEEYKTKEAWEKYGKVESFWHGQDPETKKDIRDYLENDLLYSQMMKMPHRDGVQATRGLTQLQQDVAEIYTNAVDHDAYYGVVRVLISAEKD